MPNAKASCRKCRHWGDAADRRARPYIIQRECQALSVQITNTETGEQKVKGLPTFRVYVCAHFEREPEPQEATHAMLQVIGGANGD